MRCCFVLQAPVPLPAPKMALPGHAESYNPPSEYLFTEVGIVGSVWGKLEIFSPLVTGSLVDRFHAVFVVVQIWAVWDKFGTWGYLRYLDSRISWCSCWRAMAILIILGWATQCIPRKSLANMSCEKMWILSAENGLIMMWRCYRPVPSHPDMGFDLVGLFGKKPSSPVIWTWMLNVC